MVYSTTVFVVIVVSDNYNLFIQRFYMSDLEAVIELVMKYNSNAIMVIKSIILVIQRAFGKNGK